MPEIPPTCALCNAALESRYNEETGRIEIVCPSCGGIARTRTFDEAMQHAQDAARRQATARLRRIARAAGVPEPMVLSADDEEIERDGAYSIFVGGPKAKYRLRRKDAPESD